MTARLTHSKVELALHALRDAHDWPIRPHNLKLFEAWNAEVRDRIGDEKEAEYLERYRKQGFDCSLVKIVEAHHYCLVDVGPSSLTVQTRQVTENANVSGGLLDDLELKK